MKAQLIPVDGGKPIDIVRDVTLVGRANEVCDLLVLEHSVSKLQCVIVKTDGLLYVRDLGSTNGTRVNGQRISRGALLPGDEISFASRKYRVHLGPGDPEPAHGGPTEYLTSPGNGSAPRDADHSDSDVRLLPDE